MVSSLMSELMAALVAEREARGPEEPPIEESRAVIDALAQVFPVPDDVAMADVDAGGVPARWLTPAGADPGRVLLYLHGGGYQTGSVHSHGELAARIGAAAAVRVLLVDYRRAPEHPFPAALDDARAAWRWLRHDLGVPASSLVVAGDSAGGGLAAALLVDRRQAGEVPAAAAALLSPWTDLACTGASLTTCPLDPVIAPGRLESMAARYLAGADPRSPEASPLYADLTGLPPLLVQVGTAELLLSDSERFCAAARHAGVDVTFEVGEGLPHVYQLMQVAPEARAATDRIGAFLCAHLDAAA